MNWKAMTIDDLRRHEARKDSLQNMRERIEALRAQREGVRAVSTSEPVMGGGSRQEDALLTSLCEEERLRYNIFATQILVDGVGKALTSLSPEEYKVLDRFFIRRVRNHVDSLCEELGYEARNIYKIKEQALYNLTIRLYGLIDY